MGLDWHYAHPRDVFAEMKLGDAVARATSPGNASSARARSPIRATRRTEPGHEHDLRRRLPDPQRPGQARPRSHRPARRGARRRVPDDPDHRPAARALAHRRDDPARRRARRDRARGGRAPLAPRPAPAGRRAPATRSASRPAAARSSCKARADRDVPPGLVFIPFCYAEAAANLLTNPQLDPFGKIPEFKFCAVRMEPASQAAVAAEEGARAARRSGRSARRAAPGRDFASVVRVPSRSAEKRLHPADAVAADSVVRVTSRSAEEGLHAADAVEADVA